ncbi:MAG: hypothetical protein GY756_08165 [bacterium]|nr:hypothetical protein [bacterium]
MMKKANEKANTEYMIRLPEGYNKNKKYPLIMIMHGGIGSIQSLQSYYNSPKLKSDFITAFCQGGDIAGSFTRKFMRNQWQNRLKKVYKQVTAQYSVDTTKIILGGPSAGGFRSIYLGLNNDIPSKGLLLSYTVAPRNLDSTAFIKSAERGLKVALLCGENDWAIKQQKEFAYKLDKYGVENRFVVFPEKVHEYPDNWSYYLDTSLEFIFKED